MLLALPGTASAAPTDGRVRRLLPPVRTTLPRDRAFAVVGVNGGLSTRANPCLAAQLAWAWGSSGAVAAQPRAQVYLNTANPGEVPQPGHHLAEDGTTPYGSCDGTNSAACSWQYGWERAQNSVVAFFTPRPREAGVDGRPSRYTWWLDVETMNTWQSGSPDALAPQPGDARGHDGLPVVAGRQGRRVLDRAAVGADRRHRAGGQHPRRPGQLAGGRDLARPVRRRPAAGPPSSPAGGSRWASTCRAAWTATSPATDRT